MKKRIICLLSAVCVLLAAGCSNDNAGSSESGSSSAQESSAVITESSSESSTASSSSSESKDATSPDYTKMTAEEITASLTLEEKLNQMMIPAIYAVRNTDFAKNNYGSVLSVYDPVMFTASDWRGIIGGFQQNALKSSAPIPFIYGQDSVHGVNYCVGTVIFPHNINIGCANDPELTYQMGLAVADEIKLSGMLWNYSPCVAVAQDPRWGRTYESYSSDAALVKALGASYVKGQLEGGAVVCVKHFIGDGNAVYGTGESGINSLIDRGDAKMTDEEINEQLAIYKELIDLGAQSVMVSHTALNGVKMHENKAYLTDVLRGQLGFEGVIASDWESIHNIFGASDFSEQLIIAVNAGIDWIMEPMEYKNCVNILKNAVSSGKVKQERIDDAVTRIIRLKKNAGLFDDPYLKNLSTKQEKTGSEEYRALARRLAEESLVLLKNKNDLLPIKKGTKIYVTGPAANDTGVQCGGWTRQWQGSTDAESRSKWIADAKTILDGLNEIADEYELTIITDSSKANEADITLLCVGEKPYAEWYGDTADLGITGAFGLPGNEAAIAEAKALGKPTVTLLVAGRNVIISDYESDWDAVVMCGLFGSEGDCAANVLTGKSEFSGKLSMPWYKSVDDIAKKEYLFDAGYGLGY